MSISRDRSLKLVVILWCWLGLVVAPAASQETDTKDGVSVLTVGVPQGVRAFAPGHWGNVKVIILNESDEPKSVTATAFVKDASELRYRREVWLPANSVRTTWIPVYMPQPPEGSTETNREIVGRLEWGDKSTSKESRYLVQQIEPNATAYFDDPPMGLEPRIVEGKDMPYEAVLAMRNSRNLNRRLTALMDRFVPSTIEGWDSIGHVVIAGERLQFDTAGFQSLRHWVAEGGHVWVQLNASSTETLEQLLGSSFQFTEVDRVPMNTFQIVQTDAGPSAIPVEVDLEDPVELIRAYVEGAEVLFEVDGWPAAMAFPFGKGEILVTTLEARGWIRHRGPDDPPYDDPMFYTDFMALDPLQTLAARFFEPPPELEIPKELREDYVADRIGYEVPSRGFVLSILVGFCVAILGCGIGLAVMNRLEHLSWITVVLGLLATAIVVAAGWSSRHEVPPTASNVHLVRVLPETGDYTATGTVALYRPGQSQADVGAETGIRIRPVEGELSGKIRPHTWEDSDQWSWEETSLPPGVQMIETRSAGSLDDEVRALAKFTAEGLQGKLVAGPFSKDGESGPADAVIVVPKTTPFAANLQSDGEFVAAPADRLAEGQFFNDALINDEQRRRQVLYAAFMERWQGAPLQQPMLLAWTNWGGPQLDLAEDVIQTGSTLLAVPLELEASLPGSEVTVPSAFIQPTAILSEFGQSSAFDNKTRQWNNPNSQATTTRLRFQFPSQVLPLDLEQAQLTLQCNIPSRELKIYTVVDGQREEVYSRANPAGQIEVDLVKGQSLALDDNGGLIVDIEVGELTRNVEEQTMANSGWTIRSTYLDTKGTVKEATVEALASLSLDSPGGRVAGAATLPLGGSGVSPGRASVFSASVSVVELGFLEPQVTALTSLTLDSPGGRVAGAVQYFEASNQGNH